MQPDPHPNRPGSERFLPLAGRSKRIRCARERDKERVALGVDLDAAVRRESLAQDAPMLRQRSRVALRAQLVQELGRALHVGKEEGDGAGRKLA